MGDDDLQLIDDEDAAADGEDECGFDFIMPVDMERRDFNSDEVFHKRGMAALSLRFGDDDAARFVYIVEAQAKGGRLSPAGKAFKIEGFNWLLCCFGVGDAVRFLRIVAGVPKDDNVFNGKTEKDLRDCPFMKNFFA